MDSRYWILRLRNAWRDRVMNNENLIAIGEREGEIPRRSSRSHWSARRSLRRFAVSTKKLLLLKLLKNVSWLESLGGELPKVLPEKASP